VYKQLTINGPQKANGKPTGWGVVGLLGAQR
jgi:hypothetical protein